MPAVPDSPGLLTLPTAEGANAVSARAPDVDLSFTKYGQGALEKLRTGSRMIAAHQLEEANKARDARALQVANDYYIRGMEYLVGEKGALLQKETQVTDGVDGKSYTEYHTGGLDKISRELLSGLDPETRKLAEEKIAGTRRGFIGQLYTHEGAEYRNAEINAVKTAANVAADQVSHGLNLRGGYAQIYDNYLSLAGKNGADIKSPDILYAVKRQAQVAYSKALEARIDTLIAQENPYGAASALQAGLAVGGMDANLLVGMRKKVNDAVEAHVVKTRGEMGAGMLQAEKTSTALIGKALSPTLDMVNRFTGDSGLPDDEEHKVQRWQDAINSAITQFGGEGGAMIALSFGSSDSLNKAQEAAEQKYGKDKVSPASLVEFMTPEEKAKLTKARNFYKANYGAATQTTAGEIYAMARRIAPKGASEELVQKIAVQIASDMQKAEQMRDVKSSAAVSEAMRRMENGDMSLVGVDLSALSPTQRSQFERVRHNSVSKFPVSDTKLFMDLIENPQRLTGMSETDFLLLKADLSPSDWGMLHDRRRSILGTGGPSNGDLKLDYVRAAVERYATMHRIDITSPEGKQRKAALLQIGIDTMRPLALERGVKNPLSQMDYDSSIESALSSIRRTYNGAWFSSSTGENRTIAAFKPSDIHPDVKRALAKCIGAPDDEFNGDDPRILSLYYRYLNDPRSPVPDDAIPTEDRQKIIKDYREAHDGTEPDNFALLHIYMLKKQGEDERLRAFGIKTGDSESSTDAKPVDMDEVSRNAPENAGF